MPIPPQLRNTVMISLYGTCVNKNEKKFKKIKLSIKIWILQHIFGIICNRMTHKKEEKFLIGGKIMLIGSHVGMKGKDMFLGSVKEALSYGANTFMVYTGAPQNTRRKKIEELRIEDGTKLMKEHGMETFVVHAPYIINLAEYDET